MKDIIAQTPQEKHTVNTLLAKSIPHYRQAYSDRTA